MKKFKKPLASIILSMVLILMMPNGSIALNSAQVYDKAIGAVVELSGQDMSATGFFISPELILTNYHVIMDLVVADELKAVSNNGTQYRFAGIYWVDHPNDLVILKVTGKKSSKWLKIDESASDKIGDTVLALGNPDGLNWSLSRGIISAYRPVHFTGSTMIQTDAAATFGSSGSPLLNMNGNVIGVVTAISEDSRMSFATIPKDVNKALNAFKSNGKTIDDTYTVMTSRQKMDFDTFNQDIIRFFHEKDKKSYEKSFYSKSKWLKSGEDTFDEISGKINGREFKVTKSDLAKFGDAFLGYQIISTTDGLDNYIIYIYAVVIPGTSRFANVSVISLDLDGYDMSKIYNRSDAVPEFKYKVDFKPFHTLFDATGKAFYMSNRSGKQLLRMTLDGKTKTLDFKGTPEYMAIDGQNIYISIPSGLHDSYVKANDTSGEIAIVDMATMKQTGSIQVGIDPYGLAVHGGVCYVSGGSSQFTKVQSYDVATGAMLSEQTIRQLSPIMLHPNFDRLYTVTTDISPRDYQVYIIDNGKFKSQYDSIYHGDYKMDIGFILTPKGDFMVNFSGNVFRTGIGRSDDLQFTKSMGYSINAACFDTKGTYMLISQKDKKSIHKFLVDGFKETGSLSTNGIAEAIGTIGDKIYTIESDGGYYGMNVYDMKKMK